MLLTTGALPGVTPVPSTTPTPTEVPTSTPTATSTSTPEVTPTTTSVTDVSPSPASDPDAPVPPSQPPPGGLVPSPKPTSQPTGGPGAHAGHPVPCQPLRRWHTIRPRGRSGWRPCWRARPLPVTPRDSSPSRCCAARRSTSGYGRRSIRRPRTQGRPRRCSSGPFCAGRTTGRAATRPADIGRPDETLRMQ